MVIWKFENWKIQIFDYRNKQAIFKFSIFKFSNWVNEQDHELFQRELQGIGGESDLAKLDTIAAEYGDRPGSYRNHHSDGLGDGLFQQPVIKADLFII